MFDRSRLSLRVRRKSFDAEAYRKRGGQPSTGVIGKNLGFWATAFLGFQTLGAIYGKLSGLQHPNQHLGDIGTSPLYVYTG